MSFRFPKEEKLKNQKTIEALFLEGKTMVKYPVKLYYLPESEFTKSKVAFAVPKKNFKQAVIRNRIKRQMREAYRLHKHKLFINNSSNFALLFLYINKEVPEYSQLESSISSLIKSIT